MLTAGPQGRSAARTLPHVDEDTPLAAAMRTADDATALVAAFMARDGAACDRIQSAAARPDLLLPSTGYLAGAILRLVPSQLADQVLAAAKELLVNYVLETFRQPGQEGSPDAEAPS